MKTPKLYVISLVSSAGVLVYILFVAWLMKSLGSWLPGPDPQILAPTIFLLMFVLSATIVGSLVLGYPIWLYFENKKKDALRLFGYNVLFLFVYLVLAIAFTAVFFPHPANYGV